MSQPLAAENCVAPEFVSKPNLPLLYRQSLAREQASYALAGGCEPSKRARGQASYALAGGGKPSKRARGQASYAWRRRAKQAVSVASLLRFSWRRQAKQAARGQASYALAGGGEPSKRAEGKPLALYLAEASQASRQRASLLRFSWRRLRRA